MRLDKIDNADIQLGLLAFFPLLPVTTSFSAGSGVGLVVLLLMIVLALFIYPLRNFIPISQRLPVTLLISVSVVLMVRMLLESEVFALTEKLGLFFPLLIINSLVLSVGESLFSSHGIKSVSRYIFIFGLSILVFFAVFGAARELLINYTVLTELDIFTDVSFSGFRFIHSSPGFSIFTSSAGCFFLVGFMFAMINFLNDSNRSNLE